MDTAVIALAAPYDMARSIRFWRASTGELCEHWADGIYRRVIVFEGRAQVLTLTDAGTPAAPAVAVSLDGRAATAAQRDALAPVVHHLLAADLDLPAFYRHMAHDPVWIPVLAQLDGVRAPRSPLWETLCFVIIGQQIGVGFAHTLKRRMVERYGEEHLIDGKPLYRFPAPSVVAQIDPADLRAMQFSSNKARFITTLAAQVEAGALDLGTLAHHSTDDAVVYLVQFLGIGRWTAEFTLLRGLGRADALPGNDAGVRQGVQALYGVRLPEAELRAFTAAWQPWGGIAGLYLLEMLRQAQEARMT